MDINVHCGLWLLVALLCSYLSVGGIFAIGHS